MPSYTSAARKEDFKATAIFAEMEKTLKGVSDLEVFICNIEAMCTKAIVAGIFGDDFGTRVFL